MTHVSPVRSQILRRMPPSGNKFFRFPNRFRVVFFPGYVCTNLVQMGPFFTTWVDTFSPFTDLRVVGIQAISMSSFASLWGAHGRAPKMITGFGALHGQTSRTSALTGFGALHGLHGLRRSRASARFTDFGPFPLDELFLPTASRRRAGEDGAPRFRDERGRMGPTPVCREIVHTSFTPFLRGSFLALCRDIFCAQQLMRKKCSHYF